jgi:membrane protease YdiL (CAAX protease family)
VKNFFTDSRYRLAHAIAACVVIAGLFFDKNVWRTFIYGSPSVNPSASQVINMVLMQTAFFVALLFLLWLTTIFIKKKRSIEDKSPSSFTKLQAVLFSVKLFIPVCIIAFVLESASLAVFEKIFNITLPPQDLVKWLQPGIYPDYVRYTLMFMAVIEAPLVEELLFRGVIFRGFGSKLPFLPSLILSGFVFGIVHINAATLIPLSFLGIAFAWVYQKTESILAPVTMHFLFNALNLVLCLFFPELAQ